MSLGTPRDLGPTPPLSGKGVGRVRCLGSPRLGRLEAGCLSIFAADPPDSVLADALLLYRYRKKCKNTDIFENLDSVSRTETKSPVSKSVSRHASRPRTHSPAHGVRRRAGQVPRFAVIRPFGGRLPLDFCPRSARFSFGRCFTFV